MPYFSIIIPCYNAAATIDDTLWSLMTQTYPYWEALCIDDGSCDRTRDIIDGFCERDPRIRMLQNPGKGPSDARNFGALTRARGEIICFCDADDIWTSDKLRNLHTQFQTPEVSGIYGKVGFFRSQPGDCTTRSTVPTTDLTIPDLLAENPVCTLSNLSIRKTAFIDVDGFDADLVHNEDLDLLVRLMGNKACIRGVDQLQVWYRTSPDGLSSDLPSMAQGRQTVVQRAAQFGFASNPQAEAIYARYLARRALRLTGDRFLPLRLTMRGLANSPTGFLLPLRRGGATALASILVIAMPPSIRSTLFS